MIKALILAGGERESSGLLPLTLSTPKPLLPIGNVPLLLFQLFQLKRAGIQDITLSLSYQPRNIRQVFEDGIRFGVILRYRVEATPMGTAGAFKSAENLFEDTTIVLNGDILTETSLARILEFHRKKGAEATIGVYPVDNPRAYGIVETEKGGEVSRFIERPRGKQVRTNVINAGIYVLEPSILRWIPEQTPFSFERDLFPRLLKEQVAFFAWPVQGYWTEITRPDNYLQSNLDFLDGGFQPPHFPVLKKEHHPPNRVEVEVDDLSRIDEDCILKSGARVERSVIGRNCRIEEESVIRNSVLWPGCRIQKGAVVKGSILGRGCLVGEGASLFTGRILGDKSVLTAYSRA